MSTTEDNPAETAHLLDLNDDCLLEIFKYLNVHETFSLQNSICCRIDNIIYERLSLTKQLSINLREPPQFTWQQLEVLGRHLKSLDISAGYSLISTLTLNYLQPICEQKNLQFLTLHYVHFNEHFQQCLLNVATHLQCLDLSYCQLTDDLLGPLLAKCNNLKTLTIFGNNNLNCASLSCLRSNCLKELKVEQNSISKNEIQKFSGNNPLVTVTIFDIGYLGHVRNH